MDDGDFESRMNIVELVECFRRQLVREGVLRVDERIKAYRRYLEMCGAEPYTVYWGEVRRDNYFANGG